MAAKRLLLALALAGAWSWPTAASVEAQPLPGTTCAMFPANGVFNTDISGLPVHSQSATWTSNMTQNLNLHPDLGTFAQWYGIPINVAPPPSTGVTPSFAYDSESDHPSEGYPIDQNTWIEGGPSAPSGSDRHALVVDKNRCKLYEIYNLQNFTNGQTPQAGSGAVWDLSSNGMRPDMWTSADAAGLPMAPLLLRPDEILAGSVTHAIRFTAHCTANAYIWPASHRAGSCSSAFPPMGARFRLRPSFDISRFSANTQVVLRAFQHYGLILADNGSDWYFGGTTDDWWGTTAGGTVVSELKMIPAAQFDAVDESSLQVAANSYQAAGGVTSLGGLLISGPGASAASATRVDAFGVGGDRALWQKTWNGTAWGAWASLGGVVTADPDAVARNSSLVDVVVRGQDGAVWHRYWNGTGWSAWEGLGGATNYGPVAASWGGQRLDIFADGMDNQLWHRAWDGARWWPWEALGGYLTSDPAAVSWGSNRIDVFARGGDNQLWHVAWTGTAWSTWQPAGGAFTSGPAAASCAVNHLDVFGIGLDGQLWRKGWNGTAWGTWQPVGSSSTSDPAAVCVPGGNTIMLFGRGGDNALWERSVTGT